MEIHSVDSFLTYWSKIHARTRRVVRGIPPEHLEWTYREGKFTLGDLVRHMAVIERYMFGETLCDRPCSYHSHGPELASGYDQVMAFFDRLHAETVDLIRAMPDARLSETCETPGGAQLRVWKWLRAMIEHEIHHRGQIYTYLGILGVDLPPLFGLTAEEVIERSLVPS